jgi:hypothetical protein
MTYLPMPSESDLELLRRRSLAAATAIERRRRAEEDARLDSGPPAPGRFDAVRPVRPIPATDPDYG